MGLVAGSLGDIVMTSEGATSGCGEATGATAALALGLGVAAPDAFLRAAGLLALLAHRATGAHGHAGRGVVKERPGAVAPAAGPGVPGRPTSQGLEEVEGAEQVLPAHPRMRDQLRDAHAAGV